MWDRYDPTRVNALCSDWFGIVSFRHDGGEMRERKSTMVEFVVELESLKSKNCIDANAKKALDVMIKEAKAGEFHDYKNEKYVCGKMAASSMLRRMGFIPLAKRIESGEFDEDADEADKARLKADALAGGFNEEQCKVLLGL